MGELLPDQQGRSDRQLTSDPAIGNNAGKARSRGPKPPLVVKAWVGTKILQQLRGVLPGAHADFVNSAHLQRTILKDFESPRVKPIRKQ
jgi:hypothetical protein